MPILIVTMQKNKSKGMDNSLITIKPLILGKVEIKIMKIANIKVLANIINLVPVGTWLAIFANPYSKRE